MLTKEKNNKNGQFNKGHIPWNTGIKGIYKALPHAFKKGMIPWNKGKSNQILKNCLNCNKEFYTRKSYIKIGHGKYCSHKCCPVWNKGTGGRHKTSKGYILTRKPEHPYSYKNGYIKEHRIILENYLGRYLDRKESPHHINHNKDDNRIENLMLFSSHSAHLRYERKGKYKMNEIIFNGAKLIIFLFLFTTNVYASTIIDTDKYCDAIRKAEGNPNYGILSIKCHSEAQCRQYCKNTVYNTLIKYRSTRCKTGEPDIDCLARRYAPLNANNDPQGLNKNWIKNVAYHLKKGK